jgi:hypothetical protein
MGEIIETEGTVWHQSHLTVEFRMDYESWYQQQSLLDKAVIRDLADGCSITEIAGKYGLTKGRISQLRKKYVDSWTTYINPEK